MLRQDLVDVHEFQADEAVLQSGVTLEDYEHLLVRKAVQTQILPIMNTLRRGAVKKRFAMMHSGPSPRWSRLKLLYLVPALAACLWLSAQAEEYTTYLNGKLATQEELESINPGTIEHVDVIHSQKTVLKETATESVETGRTRPGVRSDVTYDKPEQKPQFPGGDAAMQQYISQHIRYPNIAIENDAEGTINVEFFVEENGSITNVKALESSPASGKSDIVVTAYRQVNSNISALDKDEGNRALQESSEELIRGMPLFEPGRKQGKAVRTKVTLPITYQLN
jgi:TonB family protein